MNKTSKGHTTVRTKALRSVALAAAQKEFRVPSSQITVNLVDDGSRLGLQIQTPVRADQVDDVAAGSNTIFEVVDAARTRMKTAVDHTGGHAVGAINVDINGVWADNKPKRRVR
ncbi:hypothetical protein QS713_01365 [Gleimia hominis]|uniref:Uncharacterized protein n=1 Tax=Gleimia hominis TaxID=595468 RepID=A0ABU3IBX2_9ACTO|nr:hypothetical protein [Gleimia hominis]MDT3766715.1 hypothetical protein [Gleimia hominis]